MNTMQLFEKHMAEKRLSSRLSTGQAAQPGEHCKLCGNPITDVAYPIKGLITSTFTDIEIWRRADSFVFCRACASSIRDGFNRGRPEGFAATQTETGFYSEFPWNVEQMPWFRLPSGAPNVLVFPGKAYMQKHRLFRAEPSQDERYIAFWHGDIGQRFIPRIAADAVAQLEDEWLSNGYPVKRAIGDAVRGVMNDHAPDLIGHTINIIVKRQKSGNGR